MQERGSMRLSGNQNNYMPNDNQYQPLNDRISFENNSGFLPPPQNRAARLSQRLVNLVEGGK